MPTQHLVVISSTIIQCVKKVLPLCFKPALYLYKVLKNKNTPPHPQKHIF